MSSVASSSLSLDYKKKPVTRVFLRVVAVGSKGDVQGCVCVDWGWRRQRWVQSRGPGGARAVPESVHRAVQKDRKNSPARFHSLPCISENVLPIEFHA